MSGIVDMFTGGPDAPDPGATAAAQGEINRQAIYDSAAVNQMDQYGPGYRIDYTGTIGDPSRTMTYSLDPQREALARQMGSAALNQGQMIGGPIDYSGVAGVPNYGDFGARSEQVTGDMYNALMSRIEPQLQRSWDEQTTMAANRGLPMGGEAWNDVQESLNRQRQDAQMGAAGQALGLGIDESNRLFGQQLTAHQQGMQDIYSDRDRIAQEYALMLNANPYNTAQIQAPTQYQIAPADYMGLEMAKYQGQAANNASMMGGLSQLGSAAIMGSMMSDRRLKHDIRRAGTTPAGIPVYHFKYNGSEADQVGVMAQDLVFTQPDAVITLEDGYMAVNYSKVR